MNETEPTVSLEALRAVLNIIRYDGVKRPKKIIKIAIDRGLTEEQARAALARILENMC